MAVHTLPCCVGRFSARMVSALADSLSSRLRSPRTEPKVPDEVVPYRHDELSRIYEVAGRLTCTTHTRQPHVDACISWVVFSVED